MNSRSFNKQIKLYSVSPVADGFGGFTTSATLVGTYWAKLEPLGAGAMVQEYGLEDADKSMRVTIRKPNIYVSSDYFITYRDKTFKITSGPYELNYENRFLEMTCQEVIDKANVEQDLSETFFASGFYDAGFYEGAS
jgi:head-tail adaptor